MHQVRNIFCIFFVRLKGQFMRVLAIYSHQRISAVVPFGRPSWTALPMGGRASTSHHAQHPKNVATPERLNAFKFKVSQAMLRLA